MSVSAQYTWWERNTTRRSSHWNGMVEDFLYGFSEYFRLTTMLIFQSFFCSRVKFSLSAREWRTQWRGQFVLIINENYEEVFCFLCLPGGVLYMMANIMKFCLRIWTKKLCIKTKLKFVFGKVLNFVGEVGKSWAKISWVELSIKNIYQYLK